MITLKSAEEIAVMRKAAESSLKSWRSCGGGAPGRDDL